MIFIDSDDYKAAGIETLFFPGGEPHAKLPNFSGTIILYLKLRTWNDVGIAASVLDALSRNLKVRAFVGLMYFPGARQDRIEDVDVGKYPLTIHMMRNLLYYSRFKYFVFDPHSAALSQHMNFTALDLRSLNLTVPKYVGVIAPDEGAIHRATTFRDWYCPGKPLLTCTKVRDPQTGDLSGYTMPFLPHLGEYAVVDDICDGGGTFNLLVEAANKQIRFKDGSITFDLYVPHGIFSKGVGNVSVRYKRIITTDSWCRRYVGYDGHIFTTQVVPIPRLTVHPLADVLKSAVISAS